MATRRIHEDLDEGARLRVVSQMLLADELALCRSGTVLYAIELMQQSTDQQPVSLPPDQYSLGESTEEHSFGKVIEFPTPLTRKRR